MFSRMDFIRAKHLFIYLFYKKSNMNRALNLLLLTLFLTACEGPYIFNRVINLKNGDKMLLGGVSREAFEKLPFSDWFNENYEAYQTNDAMIKSFKNKLKRHRIEVFIGTWDEDSKLLYPQFVKVLDHAKFPEERMLTYAVNESKKSFYSEERGKNIENLPTFIFYKSGKEVGRIVGFPAMGSFEKEILMIVRGKGDL